MNKKTLLIGAVLVVAIFCFSLVGCAKKIATTTTSTLDQLQAAVTQLQTDVNAIELELDDIDNTALSNLVTTLQTTVNTLTTKINGIQIALDALSDNGGVSSTIEAEVTSLRVDLTSLSNTYNTLANTIAGIGQELLAIEGYDDTDVLGLIGDLADRVTDLEDAIEDFITDDVLDDFVTEDDLEDILNGIEVLNANDIYLQNLISGLQNQSSKVVITSFDEVHEQLIFRTNVAGNYAVILTFYGTGFVSDIGEVSIPTADNVRAMTAIAYATNTILKVIIEPPLIWNSSTSTWVDTNWAGNKIVGVTITTGDVQYVTVETAVR